MGENNNENIQNVELSENIMYEYYTDPIIFKDVNWIKKTKEFNDGLKDAFWFAGFYTALINCGMSNQDALNCMFTKLEYDYNLKIMKINKEMNIETAKYNAIATDKSSI